jgi:AraC-like DNA-binding protein
MLPSAALAPFIECYWAVTLASGSLTDQFMPADNRAEIVFSFSSQTQRTLPDGKSDCLITSHSYILGPRTRGYRFSDLGVPHYVAVRFKPGGIFAFTHHPLSELTDLHAPLDCIWSPQEVRELESKLEASLSKERQICILEAALIRRLAPPDHLIRILTAAHIIRRRREPLRLPALADHINLSQKHMERLFHRYVGMRPSLFSRIARFQRAVALAVESQDTVSLSALANTAGYFDQAHFNREFKGFSGSTPTEFFTAQLNFVKTTLDDADQP